MNITLNDALCVEILRFLAADAVQVAQPGILEHQWSQYHHVRIMDIFLKP